MLIILTNSTAVTLSVALICFEKDYADWVVRGWYNVQSETTRIVEVDSGSRVFYYYGRLPGKEDNKWGSPRKISRVKSTIVNDPMLYVFKKETPSGGNPREVWFTKETIPEGFKSFDLVFNIGGPVLDE